LVEKVKRASTLSEPFWRDVAPIPVVAPQFLTTNISLAKQLGFSDDFFAQSETLAALAGNAPFQDQSPVALAYAAHQFGNWVPLLGDGRAHLIATVQTPHNETFELQLKGSGPTPFSRNGDGRATLAAMLREHIVSEAMAGLRIPTTCSLAIVATGEEVYRRRREPGAVLTRVAKSHVRVGSFQFAAAHLGKDGIAELANHEIARSYPELAGNPDRFVLFLRGAIARQATLIAKWMSVGFIHGVMNTDNMAISGETIDYGPCAFMDAFHPKKTFSSIDQFGRYAWDQQSTIALWNLTRFAECLLPLLDDDKDKSITIATAELENFNPQFEVEFESSMIKKFGITTTSQTDGEFVATQLRHMMEGQADFTLVFRHLTKIAEGGSSKQFEELFNNPASAQAFLKSWHDRLGDTSPDVAQMQDVNPIYIARNHQVEAALSEAENGNMTRFNTLCALLRTPFTEHPTAGGFELAPLPDEEVSQTFCGT
jgi:serine/tyrosine/threonine adenylyltransferase